MANVTEDIKKIEESGEPFAKELAEIILEGRKQQESIQKRVDDSDSKITKLAIETSEGKTLQENVLEDLKAIRDMTEEFKKKQEEIEKKQAEIEQAILRKQIPAVVSREHGIDEEQSRKAFQEMLFHLGLYDCGMVEEKDYSGFTEEIKNHEFHVTMPKEVKTMRTTDLFRAGSLVYPDEISKRIIDQALVQLTNIRPYAFTIKIPAMAIKIPAVTAHGNFTWHRAAATRTEDTAVTFGTETINLHGGSAFYKIGTDMLQFSMWPLEQFMNKEYIKAMSYAHGVSFTTGSGTGEPEGFMTNSSVASVNQEHASLILTPDYIEKLYFSLKDPYRKNAKWAMNSLTQWAMRILKGGDGHYLLRSLRENAEIDSVMGKQVITAEAMADIAANAYPIIIADWGEFYYIVDMLGAPISIKDPFTSKTTGIVEYMMSSHVGGKVVNPEAGKKLKIAVT